MRPKIPLKKVNQTHEGFNRNINNKNEDEQLSRTPTMKDISFAKIK